ncbi:ATP-binding cassette domain-containing protein [uncultured Desulfuromusa sp.]|uniref:ATP-binding cassette domain-containing protein n=1 Tax=uncultured Desulfuromusa sp. TaxID=219183 RepID=UPI002AA6AD70|nr:ATP-binding cassette domain-containing protein [uncultured Desulfuromusa sp.]
MGTQKANDLLLQATQLTKNFTPKGQSEVMALHDLSLEVRQGEVVGVVGPDGAGKTTLLRLTAGLLLPSSGTISVLGFDCGLEAIEIQSRVGYMPQQFGLYQDLTVQENLDFYADLQGVPGRERGERFKKLLHLTGLAPFTERRAGKLSGGMKQKLGLSCALIKSPEMLLLDEPTVGVDPVSRRDLWQIVYQMVAEENIGVLVATSYLDEAERCHRVMVLHQGRMLDQGDPGSFREKLRTRVYTLAPRNAREARSLQSLLASKGEVLDATIHSGEVRCVLREGAQIESLIAAENHSRVRSSEPSFEDAFMAMVPRPEDSSPLVDVSAGNHGPVGHADEVVVKARNLRKTFGDFEAVKGINFEVRRGEIFGLLGPNGAGKSTTFRMLCGLSSVTAGEVNVAGQDLRRSRSRARSRLGYMAQIFSLYRQLSVKANLQFYGQAYGLFGRHLRERIAWALNEFDLQERQNAKAGDLPGGYRQRLAMAAALLHEPAILFLDEPTSGTDPLARREFWLRINGFARKGVTVVVTTHFMEEAEYCDHLLVMSQGTTLAQGTPEDIRGLARTDANQNPTIADAFIALAEKESAQEWSPV